MSEQGSVTKKARIEDDQPHILVAQLVMLYGIRCLKNMVYFSRCLNKAFLEWSKQRVYEPAFSVLSVASARTNECTHRAWLRGVVPRLELLSARPKDWFHVLHVTADNIPLYRIHDYSVSTCTSNVCLVYCQATFIRDKILYHDLMEKLPLLNRSIKIDHSRHTDDTFHFVVLMKWE